MADQTSSQAETAKAEAAKALGGAMMGEMSPFPSDDSLPDQSDDIADIFGLGEEAGPVPNSSKSGSDGGAPPSGASAAEGGEGQAQPATPPVPQTLPAQQGEQSQAPAQQAPQPAPAAPAAAPASGQAPAPDPTVQALTAQVQALTEHITRLQSGIASQGAGTQAPQPGSGDQSGQQSQTHPLMDYRLAMPNEVVDAIFGEDRSVAQQGLTHVINTLAKVVHDRVIRHADELVQQRLQGFGQTLTQSQQQEQMRNEYFSANPQHNDPATRFIVSQEAEALWREQPTLDWGPNAINALSARVNARLGTAAPQQQPPQPAAPAAPAQGQPAPRPAAQMGSSTRQGSDPSNDEGSFIEQVLTA